MAYISNELCHWLGRKLSDDEKYNLLINQILKPAQLLYNECAWNFTSKWGGLEEPEKYKIAMICFTDIPFSESVHHCQKYSNFGLSFDKAYLTQCLAAPVGYAISPYVYEAYSTIFHMVSQLEEIIDQSGLSQVDSEGNLYPITGKLINSKLQVLCSYLQNYCNEEFEFNRGQPIPFPGQERKVNDPSSFYYEREWRMIRMPGSNNLRAFEVIVGGRVYFKFDHSFLKNIIIPEKFHRRLIQDMKAIFPENALPNVMIFEDIISQSN